MFYFTEDIGQDPTIPKTFIFANNGNLRICGEKKFHNCQIAFYPITDLPNILNIMKFYIFFSNEFP